MPTHRQCKDAECNICRGDTHVIGPNPDTLCRDCGMPLETPGQCGLCQLDDLTL